MANRVLAAIERQRVNIAKRISDGIVTAEKVEETRKSLDMELMEYCKFQEIKSLAVAEGKLTLEEGMTIYQFLGESPDTFNNQTVEVKAVLTQMFSELLGLRLKARGVSVPA